MRVSLSHNPQLSGTNLKFVKPQEKGGDKNDFRSKRKSTNYNFNNHNSAFNHFLGAFKVQTAICTPLFILFPIKHILSRVVRHFNKNILNITL